MLVTWLMLLGCSRGVKVSQVPPGSNELVVENNEPQAPRSDGGLGKMAEGKVTVFVFLRSDCPIANRYAPEIRRLSESSKEVDWWMIYPNPRISAGQIADHVAEYQLPGRTYHDREQRLVRQTGVSITPEVAVYGLRNELVYRGRIDDRFVDFGKTRPAPTNRDLQDAIESALAGQAVETLHQPAVGCYIRDLIHPE